MDHMTIGIVLLVVNLTGSFVHFMKAKKALGSVAPSLFEAAISWPTCLLFGALAYLGVGELEWPGFLAGVAGYMLGIASWSVAITLLLA